MNLTALKRLKATAGYPIFFAVSFLLIFYLTLPFGAIFDIVASRAKTMNIDISAGSTGAAFLGGKIKNISITLRKQPGEPEAQPIMIDELFVRPSLFPLGLAYSAKLIGGKIEGVIGLGKKSHVTAELKKLDLERASLKEAVGLDMVGQLDGKVDLQLDNDLSKTEGKITLDGNGLLVRGGSISSFDLPKIDLGKLETIIKVDQGKAAVELIRAQGADGEATIEGDMTLAKTLAMSQLKLKLKFKLGDDFLKRNAMLKVGVEAFMTRDSRGFFGASIERALGNPKFMPMRN